uniref:E3 SUMO-protein ligase KIAA1586-like n=1 Tax=Chelonoidis abingdonii TaxID=106734 RepID=A0A8C0IKG6_CHEAB
CAKMSHLGVLGGKSLHISLEWQKCTIKDEVKLQIKNETDLGNCLHSLFSAIRIVEHIAELIGKQIFSKIFENYSKMYIISSKTVLVILLKYELQDSSPTIFLDLVELESTEVENIYNALRHILTDTRFDTEYLKKNLIGFCSDGARTMLGNKSGVATRLIQDFPNIIIWHCLNHRLQVALDNAISDINEISHFKNFLDKIYAIFHQSNKSQFELKQVSEELYIEIIKIGHVFGPRWASCSLKAVKAVWRAYPGLYIYFSKNQKFSDSFGIHQNKISERIERDAFKCMEFEDNCIIEKMKARLLNENHIKYKEDNLGHSWNTPKIVELFNIMDPTSWNAEEVRLPWKSGEEKLHEISKFIKFVVDLNDFRDYVENNIQSKNLPDPETIRKAKQIMNTIAISSAEAERPFLLMNIICSDKRVILTIKHISSFMTINLLGKPLSSWNPIPYVKSWMRSH